MTDPEAIQRCLELSPALAWLNHPENLPTITGLVLGELVLHLAVGLWISYKVIQGGAWIIERWMVPWLGSVARRGQIREP